MDFFNEEEMLSAMPDYAEEIAALIRGDLAPKSLSERLEEYHEKDIASALALLNEDQRGKLYGVLNNDTLSGVIEYSEERNIYLGELALKRRIAVLAMIEIGDAAEYLKELPRGERSSILSLLPDETRKELTVIASFEEDEIGSRMSTNYISVVGGIGVREAMRELVAQAAENDNVSTIYVTDGDGVFLGAITLKDLIVARAGTPLEDITTVSYPYVYATQQVDSCLERIRGYSEDSVPVLDRENRLIGVLTASELTELTRDEMGDDYAKLGGLAAEEELSEPLRRSVAKRLPWLTVLFALGLVVSRVVGLFEAVADAVPVIVSFQSLILGMAGNVGTQSLAVTVRLLTDDNGLAFIAEPCIGQIVYGINVVIEILKYGNASRISAVRVVTVEYYLGRIVAHFIELMNYLHYLLSRINVRNTVCYVKEDKVNVSICELFNMLSDYPFIVTEVVAEERLREEVMLVHGAPNT